MTTNTEQMRTHLQAFDFNSLFVSGLGWNHYRDNPLQITIESFNYALESVAEKAGFAVFVCAPDADGGIPPYPVRRKIEHQVAQRAFEHLIIFVDESRTSADMAVGQARNRQDLPAYREMEFSVGQGGNPSASAHSSDCGLAGRGTARHRHYRCRLPCPACNGHRACNQALLRPLQG